jgi:hypothetical protein
MSTSKRSVAFAIRVANKGYGVVLPAQISKYASQGTPIRR